MHTTETTKHTRGPWARQGQWNTSRGTAEVIESATAGIVGAWLPASEDGRHADADLIAAAPELLAALRLCADQMRTWTAEDEAALEAAEAAIAKAEGRG